MAQPMPVEESAAERVAPLRALLRNLANEAGELLRTEAEVIRLEMRENMRALTVAAIKVIVYGGIALLGLLSLMAFFIMGLGDLFSSAATNIMPFWIAALIIGGVFTGFGGIMALRAAMTLGIDATLPKTRQELERDRHLLGEEVQRIKEAIKP